MPHNIVAYVGSKKFTLIAGYIQITAGVLHPRPSETGLPANTYAAWLARRMDNTNSPKAKTHGYWWTAPEMLPMISCLFPSKKHYPSQPRPAIEMRATMPAFIMLVLIVSAAEARKSSMFMPAAANIRIII